MRRVLSILVLSAFASVAVADGLAPPPKGQKYVSVSNEVLLGKDVTGYVFVKRVTTVPGGGTTFSKLEFTADKATAISLPPRRAFVTVFAVPQDAATEFKTDAELFDALKANKVKGAPSIGFNATATVSEKVKGNSVKWIFTITAIDATSIKTKVEGEGYEEPKKKDNGKDSPDDEDAPPGVTTYTPRGGLWVAGLAAFAGIMLGGFWLAGRTRRKP